MAITYNNSFFDLNNRRQYPLAVADAEFPVEVISDLKISVPDETSDIVVSGIFVADRCVRVVFSADNSLAVIFSSDTRNLLKLGYSYPLKSIQTGYAGFIVFGSGVHKDWNYSGNRTVSEECLTRFRASSVPYAGLTCNYGKLTGGSLGEVLLSGSEFKLTTDVINLPNGLIPQCSEALSFQLVDNLTLSVQNPMVEMANGINALISTPDKASPVFTINNVRPDTSGVIEIHFEDHFKLTPVVENINAPVLVEEGVPPEIAATLASTVAVAVDMDAEDLCATKTTEDKEAELTPELCAPSGPVFRIVTPEDCEPEIIETEPEEGGGGGTPSTGCSAPVSIWITEDEVPAVELCGRPEFVWVTNFDSTTSKLTLGWPVCGDAAQQYQIWYRDCTSAKWITRGKTNKNTISFTLSSSKLTSRDSWLFGVSSVWAKGESPIEYHVWAPPKVTGTQSGRNTLKLSWDAVAKAEKYIIYGGLGSSLRPEWGPWWKIAETTSIEYSLDRYSQGIGGLHNPNNIFMEQGKYLSMDGTRPVLNGSYWVCAYAKNITSALITHTPIMWVMD
jgi:hypothetical protein